MNDFVLHHAQVTAPGQAPERWMLVLHGIYGSGGNFRTLARRLAAARPAWGFVLVDLRGHGMSQGAPPPHDVGSAADDLLRLADHLSLDVRGVLGHSFGGKVALAYMARRPRELDQVWVLDSDPGADAAAARSPSVLAVLAMLESVPPVLPTRERFVEIVQSHGHAAVIASWLSMQLRPLPDGGFALRLDLPAIRAMLDDYFALDLFEVIEQPGVARALHFVLGGRSDAVPPRSRARLEALAQREPYASVHVLEDAAHWVHVDAPDAVFALLEAAL